MAFNLPPDLPVPRDDGACDHLAGRPLPPVTLAATSGRQVNLSALPGLCVIFCYPRTGAPGEAVPPEWDAIPGARGCTPQACAFRDLAGELGGLGVRETFGLSTQGSAYQQEARQRNHLPFELLSDEGLRLTDALGLPTHEWQGARLTRRVTLVVEGGEIVKVFYPVFPPDGNAAEVAAWLRAGRPGRVTT